MFEYITENIKDKKQEEFNKMLFIVELKPEQIPNIDKLSEILDMLYNDSKAISKENFIVEYNDGKNTQSFLTSSKKQKDDFLNQNKDLLNNPIWIQTAYPIYFYASNRKIISNIFEKYQQKKPVYFVPEKLLPLFAKKYTKENIHHFLDLINKFVLLNKVDYPNHIGQNDAHKNEILHIQKEIHQIWNQKLLQKEGYKLALSITKQDDPNYGYRMQRLIIKL